MKSPVLLLSVLVLLFSCKNETELPKNILQPDKMQAVLWDMIRADVFVHDYVTPDSLKKEKSFSLYQQILELHNTNQQQFKESYGYYRAHPEIFKPLLDSLEKKGKDQLPQQKIPVADSAKKFRGFKKGDSPVAQ